MERADLQCWLSSLPSRSPELLESISRMSFQADLDHHRRWNGLVAELTPPSSDESSQGLRAAALTGWNQRVVLPRRLQLWGQERGSITGGPDGGLSARLSFHPLIHSGLLDHSRSGLRTSARRPKHQDLCRTMGNMAASAATAGLMQ